MNESLHWYEHEEALKDRIGPLPNEEEEHIQY